MELVGLLCQRVFPGWFDTVQGLTDRMRPFWTRVIRELQVLFLFCFFFLFGRHLSEFHGLWVVSLLSKKIFPLSQRVMPSPLLQRVKEEMHDGEQ